MVANDGPGFGDADPTQRGLSRGGSTGLGLDIARRIAEGSGGSLVIGRPASGGGSVTLGPGVPGPSARDEPEARADAVQAAGLTSPVRTSRTSSRCLALACVPAGGG
jgi:hypothetical protein